MTGNSNSIVHNIYILFIISFLCFNACKPKVTDNAEATTEQDTKQSITIQDEERSRAIAPQTEPATRPVCTFGGKVLDGNKIWLETAEAWVAIVADSATYDNDYGDSHRALKVLQGEDCKLAFSENLPVNFSPDYPYYLADINLQ